MLFRVEVLQEGEPALVRIGQSVRDVRRIDADAGVAADLAESGEKLALAAPDLHDLLASQIELVHPAHGELVCERLEAG
jgi:hypothetical protein